MTLSLALVSVLAGAAILDLPAAEIDTLKGEQHKGKLVSVTPSAALLKLDAGDRSVSLSEILELRFPSIRMAPVPASATSIIVQLHDGSRFASTSYKVANNEATLETPFGQLKLPVAAIQSVRFGSTTDKLDDAWRGILERELKKDTLVVRKKEADVLDHLGGVIGGIDDKIRFLLDGDEIPISREKIYGLIYVRRPAPTGKTLCRLHLASGEVLIASAVAWDGKQWRGTLASGPEVTLVPARLASIDFSSGKVRYLSQMEPREVKYTPYIDAVWQHLSRDRNLHGGPLRLANRTYTRGISIHSRTFLKYRLGSDFSRFQATMGIDQLVEGKGDVHVVIRGDGRVLHEAEVRGADAPVPLDLDVNGVRDLEILVDFGANQDDIADHLDLADAKVIK